MAKARTVSGLEDLEALAGRQLFDGLDESDLVIEWYWDRSDANPFDTDVLQGWIECCLPDSYGQHSSDGFYYQPECFDPKAPAREVFPESLAGYLEERMFEDYGTFDYVDSEEQRLARDALDGLMHDAVEANPGLDLELDDEDEVLDQALDSVRGWSHVDFGLDQWLDEEVCVTILVATDDERSADLTRTPALIEAALSEPRQTFLDDARAGGWGERTGLALLAASQGLGLPELWDALNGKVPGTGFARSLRLECIDNCPPYLSEVAVCQRLPLRDWATLEGMVAYGLGDASITMPRGTDARIGLYDRVDGGGSDLGISLDRDFEIPLSSVDDLMCERGYLAPGRRKAATLRWGYAVHDTYGTDDGWWGRSKPALRGTDSAIGDLARGHAAPTGGEGR